MMILRRALASLAALPILVVLAWLVSGPSFSEDQGGDATEGKAVFFIRCLSCHLPPSTVGLTEFELSRIEASLPADEEEATPQRGPSLSRLLGRKAGSLPDYQYSDAMKAADVNWTADTLQIYLLNPAAFIPKNKMHFNGLKRAGEMEDLIAYLSETAK